MTIIAYAGKDVSHWFNGDDWIKYIHPIVGSKTRYMRHGQGHRQPVVPSTRWRPIESPWWIDEKLVIGRATAKTRPIRITNTLTGEKFNALGLKVCDHKQVKVQKSMPDHHPGY